MVYLAHPERAIIQHRIGIISPLAEQVDVRPSWLAHIVPPGESHQWMARMMGTNMAYRRQALLEVGGFDEFYEWVYDESDVGLRLANAGKLVHPVQEAVVYHLPASSRNRVVYTASGRWWIQTKAIFYFAIKNGRAASEAWRTIFVRALHSAHGHWLWEGHLWRTGQLGWLKMWAMRASEIRGALSGTITGLFRPRRLIPASSIRSMLDKNEPIMKFQNDDSARQPSVDPVSGYRPAISLPDPPLRICLLSSSYPPEPPEGVGRHTHLMARGLFACGHTVHVITRGQRDEVSFYDGAYVHKLAMRLERYSRYQRFPNLYYSLNHSHAVYEQVKRLMLNEGIQVVDSPVWQLDGLVTAVSGVAPVVVRLQTAVRQIAGLQRDDNDDMRLVGEMEQTLIEQAAYWVPNSRATLDAAQKVYHATLPEGRYMVVPHGIVPVEDNEIRPFDPQRVSDPLTILYVGRLEKRKGILDLFEAIPHVLKQAPNVKFMIVGSDNSENDRFKRQTGMDYPAYFTSRYPQLSSRVQFTGAVSDDKLQSLYQSCDLFVAPSLYESFGLIYLEAMNYAKPVIGCRAGGIPEVVDHGVTGLLVEPEAPAALAEAMASLCQSPVKLREMGLAGRQRLLDKFTHIQMARGFEQAYRSVIQAWAARSQSDAEE
jgi:glycosyltransferase involved in cell wall biosynthesis